MMNLILATTETGTNYGELALYMVGVVILCLIFIARLNQMGEEDKEIYHQRREYDRKKRREKGEKINDDDNDGSLDDLWD